MSFETVVLYRPVGPKELALIEKSGFTAFPPRLPEQPIFYPVANQEYAEQIARDWNATSQDCDYSGFVTRFHVKADCMARYPPKQVGGAIHLEYWIPAEELDEFNRSIVGPIHVVAEFHGQRR